MYSKPSVQQVSVLVFLVMLITVSCGQLYLRVRYDVRAFKPRTTTELLQYLQRESITFDAHLRITEEAFEKQAASSYKPGWDAGLRPVQVRAFGHSGAMIMQWAICEGFLDSLGLLNGYPPQNSGYLDTLTLQNDLLQYRNDEGNPVQSPKPESYDLCMIVYYSRAFGEMGLGSVKRIMAYREQYPEKKILLLLVSLDPEPGWKTKH